MNLPYNQERLVIGVIISSFDNTTLEVNNEILAVLFLLFESDRAITVVSSNFELAVGYMLLQE